MPTKKGRDPSQVSFFPLPLEAKIPADAEVRLIAVFVDQLDLPALGFKRENKLGASSYGSDILLKLYLYGYLNRVRSSRRLERECCLNIEVHWLLGELTPCYHTIADFRKNHPKALKRVFREYVLLCKEWDLIEGKRMAADGTKIHGQNARKKNYNDAKLKRHLERIDESIEGVLAEYDNRDAQEASERKSELQGAAMEKLAALKQRKADYEKLRADLAESEATQISLTDPDARSLIKHGRESLVGYNIQSVVDDKHKLIVHVEATNVNDINALGGLAEQAMEIVGATAGAESEENEPCPGEPCPELLADKGYHSAAQLARAEAAGFAPHVAERKQVKKGQDHDGYGPQEFRYDEAQDVYVCPNHKNLKPSKWYSRRSKSAKGGGQRYRYFRSPVKQCGACPLRANCLTAGEKKNRKGKSLTRQENAGALERNRQRLKDHPGVYQQRQAIVEHPFGTIKRSWGGYYTLLKGLEKVDGEYNLLACCYNIRRSIAEIGVLELIERLKARNRAILADFVSWCSTVAVRTDRWCGTSGCRWVEVASLRLVG